MGLFLRKYPKLVKATPTVKRVTKIKNLKLGKANATMKAMAIKSLAAYASMARYFLIIAPTTWHADTRLECNKDQHKWWRGRRGNVVKSLLRVARDADLKFLKQNMVLSLAFGLSVWPRGP